MCDHRRAERGEVEAVGESGVAIQLEISMGPSVLDASTADRDYAKNYSSPPSVVFTKKIFNLPNLGAAANDVVWVPLDTPHTFDSSKNLVVDYKAIPLVVVNNGHTIQLDCASGRWAPRCLLGRLPALPPTRGNHENAALPARPLWAAVRHR